MSDPQITYAVKGDKLIHISQAERGMDCGCTCPACNSLLIARKGDTLAHHFAHVNDASCDWARETVLHIRAKNIIAKIGRIVLPAYRVFGVGREETLCSPFAATIANVRLEVVTGCIRPDVLCDVVINDKRQEQLAIEIYVTHPVDDAKRIKLSEKGLPCIEITMDPNDFDLSDDEIESMLTDKNGAGHWVCNPKYDKRAKDAIERWYDQDIGAVSIALTNLVNYEAESKKRIKQLESEMRKARAVLEKWRTQYGVVRGPLDIGDHRA